LFGAAFGFLGYCGTLVAAFLLPSCFGGDIKVPWSFDFENCTDELVRGSNVHLCHTTTIGGETGMNTWTAGIHYSALAILIGSFIYWLVRGVSNKCCSNGTSSTWLAKLLAFTFALSIPAYFLLPSGLEELACAAGTVAAIGGGALLSTDEVGRVMRNAEKPIGQWVEILKRTKSGEQLENKLLKLETKVKDALQNKETFAELEEFYAEVVEAHHERQARRLASSPTCGECTRPKNPMDELAARLF